jgi:hypothetical protein
LLSKTCFGTCPIFRFGYWIQLLYHVLGVIFHVGRVDPWCIIHYVYYILYYKLYWVGFFYLLVNTVVILLKLQILNVLCDCAALNMLCVSTSHIFLFYCSSWDGVARVLVCYCSRGVGDGFDDFTDILTGYNIPLDPLGVHGKFTLNT